MKAGSGWVWGIAVVVVVFAALGSDDSDLVEGSPEWCAANGLSASACDDLHTIVDVFGDSGSPGPTFADGSAMPPEVVAAGELCSILHPSDDVAFVECVFRKSAPPAKKPPERTPSVTSPAGGWGTSTTRPAPPPTLSQRAETYAPDTREQTEGEWVDSLSEVDLVIYVRDVCDEFDRGLWFWDMYERRLEAIVNQGWTSDADAAALKWVMADGVLTFCEYNVDRLPTEFLVPDELLPGESD